MATESLLQRPMMRRKSSAQNLLASFKASPNSTPLLAPISTSTGSSTFANTPTPTSGTFLNREWDTQSLRSDAVPPIAAASPAIPQGTSVEYLRSLVQRRITTLTYVRKIHEGRSHWCHTILMSPPDLDRVSNNVDLKKRTYRYAVLAMSLSNLLDVSQPQDLLRGLYQTLSEYDQSKEDSDKPKIRLFKPKLKRQAAGLTEYASSFSDASDASYLVTPHMPFPLDYHQTLLSFLDVISEVYNKISKILGPSPFPHTAQHMAGPLGALTPHPGVSYLFSGTDPASQSESEAILWGIANASVGSSYTFGPSLNWTPALGEVVLKVDGKFKKITSTLVKELAVFARNGIKDELASLDPLLRNVPGADDGREPYDFEGM